MLSNSWSRGWGVDKIQSTRVTARSILRRLVRGLLAPRAPRENGQHPRVRADGRGHARADGVARVQHDRHDRRIREAERIRHALGAPRLVGRRQRRDGQRHRHDHDARGDAHPEDSVPAPEAHDSRRPLERGRGGRHRIGRVRRRPSGDRRRDCRRCSTRTTAPARSIRVQTNGFIDAAPALARWMSRMPGRSHAQRRAHVAGRRARREHRQRRVRLPQTRRRSS